MTTGSAVIPLAWLKVSGYSAGRWLSRPRGTAKICLENKMAVPKRKTSPMKRGFRRSADALKQPTYVEDKDSGELRRPHHVDLKTGMYRGRMVLKPKVSTDAES